MNHQIFSNRRAQTDLRSTVDALLSPPCPVFAFPLYPSRTRRTGSVSAQGRTLFHEHHPVNPPANLSVATDERPSSRPVPADRWECLRRGLASAMRLLSDSWVWLKWPVAVGILAWMYYANQDNILAIAATPKIWGFAVLALILITVANLITFVRWYLLVRAQEFPFRLRHAVPQGFIGVISNYI